MESDLKKNMVYRYLGNTGIQVSVLSYGNYLNSHTEAAQQLTTDSVKRCLEYGVNFFDTAEGYGHGVAETLLGNTFKELKVRREDIVVSTKIFFFSNKKGINVNDCGLSRKHIIEGLKNCLKRLQLSYVDIVFAHRPDKETPLEETCRAFSWCIDKGLAFYWGTSEWSGAEIAAAIELCKAKGLHPPVVEQPQYNMLVRERFEKEYRAVFEKYGLGTTTWSPVAGGLLSGKYNDGSIPDGSRYADDYFAKTYVLPRYFGEGKKENTMRIFKGLTDLATELGCTQVQLCLAWGLANTDVTTQILGFSKVEQIDENMKALEIYKKWTKDIEARCEDILRNGPDQDYDYRKFAPTDNRRKVVVNASLSH